MSIETPAAATGGPLTPHRISAPLIAALEDRYEIVRETGRGASAIVYLARDLKHERLVALKTLNPDVGTVAGERFLREIQVAAGMQHPHILPMYDSGVADGRLYFVMPFVDGGSLRDRLDAEPQLPVADALQCAHDIAIALAFAHDQGVVHRDIKPENILYYHGHACLADFGVARVMQEIDTRVTGHGMVVGTPAYMSPEQLTDGGFDGRSDVYSLACVLYEMIAGVHAFSGTTPRELLEKRLLTTPEPLHKHRPDVPQFVEDLLMRALAASPGARFVDARAFADAIDFAQRDVVAVKRTSSPRRAMDAVPRHPLAWAGSIAVIVAAGALAATPIRTALRNRSLPGTGSAKASYAAGLEALQQWDLPAAEKQFAAAAATDPKMALAQLQLAHTLELQRRVDSDEFRLAVARLTPVAGTLRGRDSLLARAMAGFASRAYPQACEAFRSMRAADSLDAMAWFGLGDCQSLDSVVVRDSHTRSGWAFRTSWDAAAKAYIRATALDPAAHRALPYVTLTNLLVTAPTKVRVGHGEQSTGITFAGYGELAGDTAVFTPFPVAEFTAVRPEVISPTLTELVRRQRETLVTFARQWVTATPNNLEAVEALVLGYEARGELDDRTGALSTLRQAKAIASTPADRLRIAAIEVRLDVKLGNFAQAQSTADALLREWHGKSVNASDASRLAGFAALTGHLAEASAWRAVSSTAENASQGIAPALTLAESRLFMRAAAGVCDDSILVQRDQIDGLLSSYAQPDRRVTVRTMLLGRAMPLAYPCIGARAFAGLTPATPLDRAERAAAALDRRRAFAILDSLDRIRLSVLPGDVSLDQSVQEAWIRAALRDSAEAARRLDRILDALPTLGPWSVREEAQAAAVGRALMLRAELASTLGQDEQRRTRAQQALMLWRSADPAFAPLMARLRVLASLR